MKPTTEAWLTRIGKADIPHGSKRVLGALPALLERWIAGQYDAPLPSGLTMAELTVVQAVFAGFARGVVSERFGAEAVALGKRLAFQRASAAGLRRPRRRA